MKPRRTKTRRCGGAFVLAKVPRRQSVENSELFNPSKSNRDGERKYTGGRVFSFGVRPVDIHHRSIAEMKEQQREKLL